VKSLRKKSNKMASISLIVPAHNASDVISESIKRYSDFLSRVARKYELIIVCNACSDDTEQIVAEQMKKNKHVKMLSIKERGKGFAILNGFKVAQYEVIGFMDADCVFNLDRIAEMIAQLDKYDCVIASKWLGQSVFRISGPFTRKVLAVGWKALTLMLLQMRFHDSQAGAKFLKKRAFDLIDKNFICTGFDFDVELLYKLKKKGYRIKEFYIPLAKVYPFSTFRLRFIPGMFWRLFKLGSRQI
jgi:glycosyltransferase involved in cell wall biosynthesis